MIFLLFLLFWLLLGYSLGVLPGRKPEDRSREYKPAKQYIPDLPTGRIYPGLKEDSIEETVIKKVGNYL